MVILLPPSEGKTRAGARRRPVDLETLSFPDLTPERLRVGDALVAASRRADALALLGVGHSLEDEVRRNLDLWAAPAAPAAQIYSGVLYDALDLASLDSAARRRAARSLLVVSALWGALRVTDRIPAYRLSMTVDLPGVGPLAAFWRPHLKTALAGVAATGVLVDCRSLPYQQAWPSPAPERTVAIRVLSKDSKTAVSHMAKHTRGLVARHLLQAPGPSPRRPQHLAEAVATAFEVGLTAPQRARQHWTLEVVEP